MTVRKVTRRGETRWVIDIRYTKRDGSRGRYRKDAQVQTSAAARAEDRRLLASIAQHGEPYEPGAAVAEPTDARLGRASASGGSAMTFRQVVEEYRASFMLSDLKVTTRRGYDAVLESNLLPELGDKRITAVDGSAASKLDLVLSQKRVRNAPVSQATRNNVQIALRSVLRFAVAKKYLAAFPTGLPSLKPVDDGLLEIPSDAEVKIILDTACEAHRRSFGLMAYAGLRPNEVRALRRRDMKLQWDGERAVGGFLAVREGRSFGEFHKPKTGLREMPIAPALAQLLAPIVEGPREGFVAVNADGEPWSQYGLDQAFERVRNRAGLEGWSVYCLRHYAITWWLRRGVPVHVVQKMAGHKHLKTTQRYVHFLKEDLQEAARRLGDPTPPGSTEPKAMKAPTDPSMSLP